MTASVSKAIDPKRVGMSKSMMTSPCERKAFFGETVRDAEGRRLSFPMPERVTFGTAVDEAVAYIVWHDRQKEPWSIDQAVRVGTGRRRGPEGLGAGRRHRDVRHPGPQRHPAVRGLPTGSSASGRCTASA
jgi:hypothetical protein